MQKDDAIADLTEWKGFALAGRTQKPTLGIISDPDIQKAIE